MGAGEINGRAVAMPERCRCSHTRARHELPGFDGECVATDCRCTEFRLVEHEIAQPPAPARRDPAVSGVLNTVEQVVAIARSIGTRRMLLTAARVDHQVAELRALIVAERAKARDEAARQQIVAIDRETKATAKARKPPKQPAGEGPHACGREGCDRSFITTQAAAMHRRRAHEGFDPRAKKDTEHHPTEGATA
jgi:hypothetical protein